MATTLIRGGTVVNADFSERSNAPIGDGKTVSAAVGVRIRTSPPFWRGWQLSVSNSIAGHAS